MLFLLLEAVVPATHVHSPRLQKLFVFILLIGGPSVVNLFMTVVPSASYLQFVCQCVRLFAEILFVLRIFLKFVFYVDRQFHARTLLFHNER